MNGPSIAMPVEQPREDVATRVGALFDLHHQRVYTMARRLSRSADDARDLVQETFLRAARSAASIPSGSSREEAWLVRVLINICRDRWRHSGVRQRARLDGRVAARPAVDPERSLIARSMIRQALDALPPRRRAILIPYELEGSPIPAIARMIGVSPVTVPAR
jgi:RNA polymerase sigma-70 factor (ECF subfamily)